MINTTNQPYILGIYYEYMPQKIMFEVRLWLNWSIPVTPNCACQVYCIRKKQVGVGIAQTIFKLNIFCLRDFGIDIRIYINKTEFLPDSSVSKVPLTARLVSPAKTTLGLVSIC